MKNILFIPLLMAFNCLSQVPITSNDTIILKQYKNILNYCNLINDDNCKNVDSIYTSSYRIDSIVQNGKKTVLTTASILKGVNYKVVINSKIELYFLMLINSDLFTVFNNRDFKGTIYLRYTVYNFRTKKYKYGYSMIKSI